MALGLKIPFKVKPPLSVVLFWNVSVHPPNERTRELAGKSVGTGSTSWRSLQVRDGIEPLLYQFASIFWVLSTYWELVYRDRQRKYSQTTYMSHLYVEYCFINKFTLLKRTKKHSDNNHDLKIFREAESVNRWSGFIFSPKLWEGTSALDGGNLIWQTNIKPLCLHS